MLHVRMEEGKNEREEETMFQLKKNKGRAHLEDRDQDGRMILKRIICFRACISKRDPSGCIMRHAATFVHYVYNIDISQECKWLGVPLAEIFPRAAGEPAA